LCSLAVCLAWLIAFGHQTERVLAAPLHPQPPREEPYAPKPSTSQPPQPLIIPTVGRGTQQFPSFDIPNVGLVERGAQSGPRMAAVTSPLGTTARVSFLPAAAPSAGCANLQFPPAVLAPGVATAAVPLVGTFTSPATLTIVPVTVSPTSSAPASGSHRTVVVATVNAFPIPVSSAPATLNVTRDTPPAVLAPQSEAPQTASAGRRTLGQTARITLSAVACVPQSPSLAAPVAPQSLVPEEPAPRIPRPWHKDAQSRTTEPAGA
jgi:hypothetical protein